MDEAVPHLQVRQLTLQNFRNYEDLHLTFPGGVIAIVGSNGQGKTNIVEAIGYLSTLHSHRVASDIPLIRHDHTSAVIAAEVIRGDRALMVDIQLNSGRANQARINKVAVPRTREILGVLTSITFAPEDLAIVRGDPSERRAFLNDIVTQQFPRLSGVMADYDRVLKQRNALLKSAGGARRNNLEAVSATLSVWDEQLVEFGTDLMCARNELIMNLAPLAASTYAELAPHSEPLLLSYDDSLSRSEEQPVIYDSDSVRAAFFQALEAKRHQELDRGITLVGPHRDELRLTLGRAPVKGYASHGESWSVALALRLGSYDLLTRERATPVLILDDVFAELDTRRRRHLAERVADAPQAFITAAVDEDVPVDLVGCWLEVDRAEVTQRDR
jgi:DNA replication and repair protein RecF